jgi:hypothetical protein
VEQSLPVIGSKATRQCKDFIRLPGLFPIGLHDLFPMIAILKLKKLNAAA